eukprot:jgi/Hompol1/2741/HPOL_000630-RA
MPKAQKPKLVKALQKQLAATSKRSATAVQSRSHSRMAKPAKPAKPAKQPKKIDIRSRKGFEFEADDTVLLVGEGNFSFASSLMDATSGQITLVATAFDTEQTLLEKYPDSKEHLQSLEDWEVQVLFGVDATALDRTKSLRRKRFTKIIFNFPHVGLGIKDQDRNVQKNQQLIALFLESAKPLLASRRRMNDTKDGLIFITLKTGPPYDLWNVKGLAKACDLVCIKSFAFDPDQFPRYSHRRTIGFEDGISAADNSEITKNTSRTYAFGFANEEGN